MIVRSILRRVGLRREAPTDLRVVLREIEEKVFRNRMTKPETEAEEFKTAMDRLLLDPTAEAKIKRERERAEEKKRLFRSYRVNEAEDSDAGARDVDTQLRSIRDKMDRQVTKFFEVSNFHEFQKRALRFFDSARWEQMPDIKDTEETIHEHGRYDVYKGVFADLKATAEPAAEYDAERSEKEYFGEAIRQFMEELGDEVMGKDFFLGANPAIDIFEPESPRLKIGESENADQHIAKGRQDYRKYLAQNKFVPHLGIVKPGSDQIYTPEQDAYCDPRRLGSNAKFNIYSMYLEGASIKDISMRYGITAQRVKAVIWTKQYLFECVVPRVDKRTLLMGIEVDAMASKATGTCDYGLDLDWMPLETAGNIDYGIYFKDQNQPPEQKLQQRSMLQKEYTQIIEKKRKFRVDLVSKGLTSMDGKGFMLKEEIRHKGAGAHNEGFMFRRILRNAARPAGVPRKVMARLDQGPRAASLGFERLK